MKKLYLMLCSLLVVFMFVVELFADGGNSTTGFMSVFGWLKTNWESVLAIIGGLVSVATVIVKLTPTQKDDNFLSSIINFLSIFSLVNPDGSFVGKKKD